jgi:cysteinyl-tRNA synthetase
MSLSHLGEAFDIHGGGSDLMFPHHEAEIFQSECCLGHEPVVQFWMHNGMINVDGEKMSKSLGNFWTIRDAFGKVDPLELRYAMINAPYRQPVEFNSIMLEDACMHQRRLVAAFSEGLSRFGSSDWSASKELSATAERLSTGMDDDFNTRVAIVEVQSVVRNLRGLLDSNEPDEGVSAVVGWLSEFAGRVLGLLPDEGSIAASLKKEESARSEIAECVEALLSKREDARESKDWGSADSIRDELSTMGVVVEDGPEGPTWRLG